MFRFCAVCKVKQGPNKGQIEPAIVRKIPLQNITKVSARSVVYRLISSLLNVVQ